MGGLGNQMFQYALGLSISEYRNDKFQIDTSILLNRKNLNPNSVIRDFDLAEVFNIEISNKYIGVQDINVNKYYTNFNKFLPLNIRKYYTEKHFHFNNEVYNLKSKDLILEGYWQSYKYFQNNQNEIKRVFTFKNPLMPNSVNLMNIILNTDSVCINVRRGDFINDPILELQSIDFYINSINYLRSIIKTELTFFVFSDDMEWCKNNFNFLCNSYTVDHTHKGLRFSNYLLLMSSCKHFIIPNSTFGWWAAYMSSNKNKKIIAPKNWFKNNKINTLDLIPNSWIKI
jgi:hypothetical protein